MKKLIEGYENYSICIDGTIMNEKLGTVKSCWIGNNGYRHVDLYKNNINKKISIHRLIALHFIPNPDNKRTVNHIDGNKLNNSLSNLEWSTDSENIKHAYDNGLNSMESKVKEGDMDKVFELLMKGNSLTDIVHEFEFNLPTLSTHFSAWVKIKGIESVVEEEFKKQKNKRMKEAGISKRVHINLQMLDKETMEILHTFNSFAEARDFLGKKSCGPISNVIAGRSKTGYGYIWKKI